MPGDRAEVYRAYLLRCWREGQDSLEKKPTWRFSVEEVLGGRRRWGFRGLEELVVFLRRQMGDSDLPGHSLGE